MSRTREGNVERGCRWRIGEGEWWRLEDYAGVRV